MARVLQEPCERCGKARQSNREKPFRLSAGTIDDFAFTCSYCGAVWMQVNFALHLWQQTDKQGLNDAHEASRWDDGR